MARRMTRNSHVRCRTGEKVEECRTKTLPIVMMMIEIIDSSSKNKMLAMIIAVVKYMDDRYIIYAIDRGNGEANIFVSKLVVMSEGYTFSSDFANGEKALLDKIIKKVINKEDIPNYVRWGSLIYCDNIEEIPDIVRGIMTCEECNLIMSKLDKLTREDLFMSEEETLRWMEWEANTIRNDAKKNGHEEGLKEGIEQGIEQTMKNNIRNMIKKGISLEDISDITGKNIEEINKYID